MMPRTFVCGSTLDARAWCRANHVRPFSNSTYLISTLGVGGRGIAFTASDRVVFVGVTDESRLWASLGPAGLGSVVQPERA